jgi:hypothetical protein
MSYSEDEQLSRQRAQFEPSSSFIGENFSQGADNGSKECDMRSNDSSFELQDDRDYVRHAFQEIEDELYLNPEWWRRIEAPIVWIVVLGWVWTEIYLALYTSYTFSARRRVGRRVRNSVAFIQIINLVGFYFLLCFLFCIVRKIVYYLCVRYGVVRPVEEYINICKWCFFILLIPLLYFFHFYILWCLSAYVVVL